MMEEWEKQYIELDTLELINKACKFYGDNIEAFETTIRFNKDYDYIDKLKNSLKEQFEGYMKLILKNILHKYASKTNEEFELLLNNILF